MKKAILAVLLIVLVSSSVLALSWRSVGHTQVRKCQNHDWQDVKIGVRGKATNIVPRLIQGDIGQQALAGGYINGTTTKSQRFTYLDRCLNEKTLEERSCSQGKGVSIGVYADIHHVDCPSRCNNPDATHQFAWCS